MFCDQKATSSRKGSRDLKIHTHVETHILDRKNRQRSFDFPKRLTWTALCFSFLSIRGRYINPSLRTFPRSDSFDGPSRRSLMHTKLWQSSLVYLHPFSFYSALFSRISMRGMAIFVFPHDADGLWLLDRWGSFVWMNSSRLSHVEPLEILGRYSKITK